MVDISGSAKGWHSSMLLVGLVLVIVGAAVMLLSGPFEATTTLHAVPIGANLLLLGFIASMYGARRAYPMAERFEPFVAIGLLLFGIAMFFIATPARKLQLETEVLGSLAAVVGLGIGIASFRKYCRRRETAATFAEKSAVVSAAACVAIIALGALALGDVIDSVGRGLFVLKMILLCGAVIVIESIVRSLLSRSELESDEGDERDAAVRHRAARAAHSTLLTLLVPFVLLIAVLPEGWVAKTTAKGVGLQIFIMVMIAELVRHSTAAWLYRRDRT